MLEFFIASFDVLTIIFHSAITVNGSLPGPLLSANKGDTFQINVTDGLTDTTMYRGTSIVS